MNGAERRLAYCAARYAQHLNEAHQAELRRFLAARCGVAVGEIAGVAVATLDGHGALLHWVDPRGSHVLQLSFPTCARTPQELAGLFRGALTVPGGDG